ncbi:MAG TPA: Gfo/Idh/MocA family oxidoreductase [Bryobacteraceae bacterium]|nr:Gfo/Idh/MocA family oxidoreductase [Bryobacteraceae bacterium]
MQQDRRGFLKGLAAAPLFVPAAARGANDRPAFGMIGTGSRGQFLHTTFQKLGAPCVAVCDVYEPYLERARADSPQAKPYVNYRDLLQHKGIDFVVIGTPDHHHCPMLLDALAAGKDVYIEKPLSLNIEESTRMVEAARKSDRIIQVGMHRRSMPFVHKAKELIDTGILGRIALVKPMWNWNFRMPLDNSPLPGKLDWDLFQGSAPRKPLQPKFFRWWRGFWAYSGGNMTDQGTHLMDVVQWMTNSGPPRSAVCQGQIAGATEGEVPDVFSAVFEYPNFLATWTLNYTSSYDYDWSILFQGDKASMLLDRTGYKVFKDTGPSPQPWRDGRKPEITAQEPDRDSASAHQQNFLDCIRSRKQPNCTVEIAAAAVAGPHMANLAYRQDKKIRA